MVVTNLEAPHFDWVSSFLLPFVIRFPHLVLSMVGLPMPRAFAALMCAPDLANLKDLALRSVALIDEFGIPHQVSPRDQREPGYMSDNWAF